MQLTASGDFEEALALCKLLPPEDSSLRAAKEGSIHIRCGISITLGNSFGKKLDETLIYQVKVVLQFCILHLTMQRTCKKSKLSSMFIKLYHELIVLYNLHA